MFFGTIFWNVILGWYYDILGWYYDILGWKLCKQTSYWPKTGFFSVKNYYKFSSQNIVISSQNIVISSQNNVPKYCTKGHKQV